ncbi:MAG TPA: excinuclease ABC subunit UvrC [Rhabdochlamydiaceae bacterium]|nr:excinuclease ABC subunit UvrC [Rhabdochlamydiaceae bacterium]
MNMDLDQFPKEPGVYLMKNQKNEVIYVGKAKVLKVRIKQYFSGHDDRAMIPFLRDEIARIDTIVVDNEKEALIVENTLIKKHQPKYNAILKDDKTFISLMINKQHQWPMVRLIRNKGKPKEKGLYFGPYTSAYAARQTFELITRLFPLRQCSDAELMRRTRPCLLYGIKRCIAPCVGLCSKEEYDLFVEGAIQFLKGHDKEVVKKLYEDMQKASDKMEFEQAAAILNTIKQVEHVTQMRQFVSRSEGKDTDCLGLYRHADEVILMQLFIRDGKLVGTEHYSFPQALEEDRELLESFILQFYKKQQELPSEILLPLSLGNESLLSEILYEQHHKKIHLHYPKKGSKKALVKLAEKNAKAAFEQERSRHELKEKMLMDLSEKLKLNRYPKRIECFDTSNISGTDLVAAMVAFTDGEKDTRRSRLYKIRDIHKGDDYKALHQVLTRRLSRAKDEDDLPDLVIVDGGKAQLNVATSVFKELDIANVDVIAITKEEAKHTKGLTAERIFVPDQKEPVHLGLTSPLLFLLQKIRDEAHSRAIRFHRKRREKRLIKSELTEIPGIGKIKQSRLLRHFGSLKRIKEAKDEELAKVKGITKKDIRSIKSAQLT